jgi:integrase
VGGRRRKLAEGPETPESKARATRELHRILSEEPGKVATIGGEGPRVRELVAMFLDHATESLKPLTVDFYQRHLDSFKAIWGDEWARDIKPRHILEWLAGKSWAPSTKRGAITSVKRTFSWAAKQGYLISDPVAHASKPPVKKRDVILTTSDFSAILAASSCAAFRDLLVVLMETGCRPSEAARVEARNFDPDEGTWVMEGKTSGRTGRPRVVVLTPVAVVLCRDLAAIHPTGPLFRNSRGDPWTRHAYGHQFRRLRAKLGLGKQTSAGGVRHLWITDALERGIPIATVAELAGHSGTAMIDKHYGHLSDRTDHLRTAVAKIRPPKG